ncbi:multiple epidermal growth factor-like domains protein 10 [Saccostrea cucullata]|uniref:multiple epidermal growth factor-like domains protein 10 n=1 Tax=Saccostrea cuccullata TaxID=36930 RepID=UPI002ED2D63B
MCKSLTNIHKIWKTKFKMRIVFKCLLLYFVSMEFSTGYDDISAHKPSKQYKDYFFIGVAQNAVDRSPSTCSSDASNPTWWYVDIGNIKSIYDVEIYFSDSNGYEQRQRERMYGYKLYISNSSDFSLLHEAYLCYSHTGPELPDLHVTHVCVSFGRYVIFYNERVPGVTYPGNQIYTYTQLCEVIVQGCARDGVYGRFCNKSCPTNCQERRCYITNGTCAGCKEGWIGGKCIDACPHGYYGAECRRTCPERCKNNFCNHVTGQCEGCISGWMGYDCNETCFHGMYGENCVKHCSRNCAKEKEDCNRETGDCYDGCKPGYRGSKCEQECDFGTYGENCVELCSGNCLHNRTCNKLSGECMGGTNCVINRNE